MDTPNGSVMFLFINLLSKSIIEHRTELRIPGLKASKSLPEPERLAPEFNRLLKHLKAKIGRKRKKLK